MTPDDEQKLEAIGFKFKVGQSVLWRGSVFKIQLRWLYYNKYPVYDFEKTTTGLFPMHFTGISEEEISPVLLPEKPWWEFWK